MFQDILKSFSHTMFSSFPWNSLLLLSCVLLFYQKGAHCSSVRQKRNLYQLFQMVLKDTDKDPLDFIDYGCYCGLGGSGQPVDDIDRCCQQHDLCYDGVAKKCTNPKIETYKWSPGNPIHCNNEEGTCEYRTCMCDRALNECFNKYTAHPETANKNKRC